ncbi:hypothetical protein BDV93DRAFT_176658 [Ceratobasidium sp. AG-I]|nr:hypothetical protein BDV93DRAFT_176658 [Ceratobasidium sp. AG-I]
MRHYCHRTHLFVPEHRNSLVVALGILALEGATLWIRRRLVSGLDENKANYHIENSNECLGYNACTLSRQFAASPCDQFSRLSCPPRK